MSKCPNLREDTFSGCVEQGSLTLQAVSVVDVRSAFHQQFHSLQPPVPARVVKRSLAVLVSLVQTRPQRLSHFYPFALPVTSQIKYQVLLQVVLIFYVHS